MIFITVGTQKFQFDRLIRQIDELIEQKKITEDVFAQIGNTEYLPRNYKYQRFLKQDEFDALMKQCSVAITHSGVATIMRALSNNKPVVVVPRLAKFGEHVDNHQLEIAVSFYEQNLVMMCTEIDEIIIVINEARNHKFGTYTSQRKGVLSTIREYLKTI